jgi:poly(3-hydroxybutyrate) depolymerase
MGVCSFERTNTEKLLVHTGRLYKPDGSRRLIVWLHGSGDDHAEMLIGSVWGLHASTSSAHTGRISL